MKNNLSMINTRATKTIFQYNSILQENKNIIQHKSYRSNEIDRPHICGPNITFIKQDTTSDSLFSYSKDS